MKNPIALLGLIALSTTLGNAFAQEQAAKVCQIKDKSSDRTLTKEYRDDGSIRVVSCKGNDCENLFEGQEEEMHRRVVQAAENEEHNRQSLNQFAASLVYGKFWFANYAIYREPYLRENPAALNQARRAYEAGNFAEYQKIVEEKLTHQHYESDVSMLLNDFGCGRASLAKNPPKTYDNGTLFRRFFYPLDKALDYIGNLIHPAKDDPMAEKYATYKKCMDRSFETYLGGLEAADREQRILDKSSFDLLKVAIERGERFHVKDEVYRSKENPEENLYKACLSGKRDGSFNVTLLGQDKIDRIDCAKILEAGDLKDRKLDGYAVAAVENVSNENYEKEVRKVIAKHRADCQTGDEGIVRAAIKEAMESGAVVAAAGANGAAGIAEGGKGGKMIEETKPSKANGEQGIAGSGESAATPLTDANGAGAAVPQ